jgi:lipoprotein-anchoring transpeptidase ErfK/SrfK
MKASLDAAAARARGAAPAGQRYLTYRLGFVEPKGRHGVGFSDQGRARGGKLAKNQLREPDMRHARSAFAVALMLAATAATSSLRSEPLSLAPFDHGLRAPFDRILREPPREPWLNDGAASEESVLPPQLRRQVVDYPSRDAPGTIIIDTPNTYLYYVLGGGKAVRYGIGVGREGFTWSGVESISRMAEWPDWSPPQEMISRQPYLPRFMAGGPGNPLGARALYLGNTAYRVHGTNDPTTIGHRVSSGCIRLTNADIIDLYGRARLGGKVIVLPAGSAASAGPREPRSPPAVAAQAQSTAYR